MTQEGVGEVHCGVVGDKLDHIILSFSTFEMLMLVSLGKSILLR